MARASGSVSPDVFLNPETDIKPWRAVFDAERRVRVPNLLKRDVADRVLHAMTKETPWKFALRVGEEDRLYTPQEWQGLGFQEQQKILMAGAEAARTGFHYAFEYYQMLTAYMENWRPETFLHALAAFIRSDAFVEFGRALTGIDDIVEADCQATRYRPGHYLTMHHDHQIKRRRAAYVMGFTPQWRPDWGGMLQFFDGQGDVICGFMPTFNTLAVFSVPQDHAVSFVAPCAGGPRLTVTGWFLSE